MTLPTVRPRRSSGTRCATNGSSTCAPVEHRPIAERCGEKGQRRPGQGRGDQRDGGDRERDQHQSAILDEIGQRHEQQQADAIADLGDAGDRAGEIRSDTDLATDRRHHRLGIIEIGDKRRRSRSRSRR